MTGGNPSQIYGTIQTTDFPGANLFLMNPAGVLFGATAVLDLGAVTGSAVRQPGSFYATTADYLNLGDANGTSPFYADPAKASVLSVAPVAAFGFTASNPVSITIEGSTLMVGQGQTLSIVGGNKPFNKTIQEDPLIEQPVPSGVTVTGSTLSAPGGQIQVVSVASPGEVLVPSFQTGPNIDGAAFTSFGSVSLAPGSTINVSGASTVSIRGGQVVLSVNDAVLTTSQTPGPPETISLSPGSSIVTSNSGTDPGADVQLIASHVQMDGASMKTETFGDGHAGDIRANVGTLSLANGATIRSNNFSFGIGQSGNITVQGLGGTDTAAAAVTISGQDAFGTPSGVFSETQGNGEGGRVSMTTQSIALENGGTITASSLFGNGAPGDIELNVGTLSLTGGAIIQSSDSSFRFGPGANISIQGVSGAGSRADSVTISNPDPFGPLSGIFSDMLLSGDGAHVSIAARSLALDGGATIATRNQGDGLGGALTLMVGSLSLTNGATIFSSAGGFGPGGNISVSADGAVTLSGVNAFGTPGGIQSDRFSFDPGPTGGIEVSGKTVSVADGAIIQSGSIFSSSGGNVSVTAQDSLIVSNGSTISSQAFLTDVGSVFVSSPVVTLDNGSLKTSSLDIGNAGPITVVAGSLNLNNGAAIDSRAFGAGRAGDITVTANRVSIANGAQVISSSEPFATGAGGQVFITAHESVSISGGGSILSQALSSADAGRVAVATPILTMDNGSIITNTASTGNAGGITITTTGNTLSLANGSRISSASTGETIATNPDGTTTVPGTAGNVTITDAGSFTSDASTVATSAEANHGGDIIIKAQSVGLSNGTLITANSKAPLEVTKLVLDANGQLDPKPQVVGDGNAGNITIQSGSTFVMNNSKVTTEASQASGGQIEITAPEMVQLINSRVSTTVAGSATDTAGGNIKIDPQFVILQNSQILAQAFAGAGGAIDITAGVFLADPASIVDASSTLGISGTVNIQSPVQNVGGQLTPLSQQFSSAAALLAQQCAARAADGKFSTFVVAGREGLPVEPGGFLASPSLTAELLGSSLSGRDRQTQFSAVTGLFPEYDARPIQLAMFGNACHRQ